MTSLTSDVLGQNVLLQNLSGAYAESVLGSGTLVDLRVRQEIYNANQEICEAYFPITAVLSVVAGLQNGQTIEVGTIGCEGVSGIPLLLGSTMSENDCYCQVPGTAISVPRWLFAELQQCDCFRPVLDQYLQAYINLLGQLAACNHLHNVYQRCARWLLMTQDRVKADTLPLTHEYLGMMLGTHRSGVTIASEKLKAKGLIAYTRGHITILDRTSLEAASCECYAVAKVSSASLAAHYYVHNGLSVRLHTDARAAFVILLVSRR